MRKSLRPTAATAASAASTPLPLASRRPNAVADSMDSCLREFACRVSEPTYAEVTGLLTRLLEKVTKSPQEAKFRKILLAIPPNHKTLGAFP